MSPATYQSTQSNRLARVLSLLIAVVAAISLLFAILAFVGYGTLKISAPAGAIISVNGHRLSASTQRLRAGTYVVTVLSPTSVINQGTVAVHSFLTTTYTPRLEKRSPAAIVSSTLGSYESFGIPVLDKVKWFENDTWFVGSVGPGSASQIAMHYTNGAWSVAYFSAGTGYPTDLSALPTEVANYIITLQEAVTNAG